MFQRCSKVAPLTSQKLSAFTAMQQLGNRIQLGPENETTDHSHKLNGSPHANACMGLAITGGRDMISMRNSGSIFSVFQKKSSNTFLSRRLQKRSSRAKIPIDGSWRKTFCNPFCSLTTCADSSYKKRNALLSSQSSYATKHPSMVLSTCLGCFLTSRLLFKALPSFFFKNFCCGRSSSNLTLCSV